MKNARLPSSAALACLAALTLMGCGNSRPPDEITLTFDFTRQITDAVRLETYESEDGNVWSGGLTVFDRRPYDPGPITSSQGKERIYLGTQNGNAGLAIRDGQGRERIRIGVDSDGAAVIEILDESGNVVQRLPEG